MVSYEDILYTYNFSYGIREIYDLAPWAFDLLIFALVLSAIFKPVFRKLPIFAGHGVSLSADNKSSESDRLAGILALVFAGSTVYWMQVQNTNLMAASAYLILIMFAILGIFVYNLIASTEWGKKHKVISGVLAFVLTFGLCQALFGVGDIFSDVFPIITALLVFFSRILLWVIFFTAIILLLGRFGNKEGESGGGGGGPSGGGPSSSGGGGFWNKAKSWIPYRMRTTGARKELDIKEYEKNASNLELEMEEANNLSKELDKILQFQSSAIEKLKKFFKDLPAWLDQINNYFKKQKSLPPKQANDIVRFTDRITEFSEAFNATIQTINAEFDKIRQRGSKRNKEIADFERKLEGFSGQIIDYNSTLQAYSDFFRQINDTENLKKLAGIARQIADFSSTKDTLTAQVAELNYRLEESNKLFPNALTKDLFEKIELLKNFLELTNAKMKRLLVERNPTNFSAGITVLKESALNTMNHASNLDKTAKEVRVKNERFSKINSEMEKIISEVRNTIKELSNIHISIHAEFDLLNAESIASEKKIH